MTGEDKHEEWSNR